MINLVVKYRFHAIAILLLLVLIPFVLSLFVYKPAGPITHITPVPTLAQSPEPIVPALQKSIIGKTPESEVDKNPGFLRKESLNDGRTKYVFESPLTVRPNEIITRDGRVVYEKALTPSNPSSQGYTTVSEMINQYGQPEKLIKGSKFYGWGLDQYIYASKGFSFVGNSYNDEVYEFGFFGPMSIENYVGRYGDDITDNASPPIE